MFEIKNERTIDGLCDIIKTEFRSYQTESIPNNYFMKNDEPKQSNTQNQQSYWKYAYGVAGIEEHSVEETKFRRIDDYWLDVSKMCDESTGKPKYLNLWKLIQCILVLPHGNTDPERGFSINKYVLQVHGLQIKEDTIEAVRLVKEQIIKRNGIMDVPITKDLLKSCQSASQKYNVYLEAKKDEEELRKKGVRSSNQEVSIQ